MVIGYDEIKLKKDGCCARSWFSAGLAGLNGVHRLLKTEPLHTVAPLPETMAGDNGGEGERQVVSCDPVCNSSSSGTAV